MTWFFSQAIFSAELSFTAASNTAHAIRTIRFIIHSILWWVTTSIKGIVQPKMKIVIYSPSCRSNPVWVSFLCWTQKMIFWRMLVIKQLMVSIEFHSISFRTMEVNGDKQLKYSSKYLLLWSTEERNLYRFGIKSWWVNVGRLLLEWKKNAQNNIFIWNIYFPKSVSP